MSLQLFHSINNCTYSSQLFGLLGTMNKSNHIEEPGMFLPISKSLSYIFGERVLKPLIDASCKLGLRTIKVVKWGFSPIDRIFSKVFNFGVEAAAPKPISKNKFGFQPMEKETLTKFMNSLANDGIIALTAKEDILRLHGEALAKLHPFDMLATINNNKNLVKFLIDIKGRWVPRIWAGFKDLLSGQINNNSKSDLSEKVDQFLLQIGMKGKHAENAKGFIKNLEKNCKTKRVKKEIPILKMKIGTSFGIIFFFTGVMYLMNMKIHKMRTSRYTNRPEN